MNNSYDDSEAWGNTSFNRMICIGALVLITITTHLHAQGILLEEIEGHSMNILNADDAGIVIDSSYGRGLSVFRTGEEGIYVRYSENDGLRVLDVADDGISVSSAGDDGIYITSSGDDGVKVSGGVDDGVYVSGTQGDGVHVAGAGEYSLHIVGNKSTANLQTGHIALLRNASSASSSDVLALKVGTVNPGAGANFITLYDGSNSILGQVQGNGSGGISYESTGADYAEYLPVENPEEEFQAGDIVGIYAGRISHRTNGADHLMVITDRAAVVGNQPQDPKGYEKVSFIGQVPVRVGGTVRSGDWIVADGEEHGMGVAIPTEKINRTHRIIGRAWESSNNPAIKRINTAVGLDHSEGLFLSQQKQINALEKRLEALMDGKMYSVQTQHAPDR